MIGQLTSSPQSGCKCVHVESPHSGLYIYMFTSSCCTPLMFPPFVVHSSSSKMFVRVLWWSKGSQRLTTPGDGEPNVTTCTLEPRGQLSPYLRPATILKGSIWADLRDLSGEVSITHLMMKSNSEPASMSTPSRVDMAPSITGANICSIATAERVFLSPMAVRKPYNRKERE